MGVVRVEIRPALEMERLFEAAVRHAQESRTSRDGTPEPLDLALVLREFRQEVEGASAPRWVQRLGLAPLAWIGQRADRAALHAGAMPPGRMVRGA